MIHMYERELHINVSNGEQVLFFLFLLSTNVVKVHSHIASIITSIHALYIVHKDNYILSTALAQYIICMYIS